MTCRHGRLSESRLQNDTDVEMLAVPEIKGNIGRIHLAVPGLTEMTLTKNSRKIQPEI